MGRIAVLSCVLLLLGSLSGGCQGGHWWARRQVFTADLRPSEADVTLILSRVHRLQMLGRSDLAIQELLPALRQKPENPKLLNALGICYDLLGDHGRAQQIFQQVLTLDPQNQGARNNLGYSFILSGAYPQAARELEQLLRENPNNERARNNLGLALAKQGRYDQTLRLWEATWGPEKARDRLRQLAAAYHLALPPGLQESMAVAKPGRPEPEKQVPEEEIAEKAAAKPVGKNCQARLLKQRPGRRWQWQLVQKLTDSLKRDCHWEKGWEAGEPQPILIF